MKNFKKGDIGLEVFTAATSSLTLALGCAHSDMAEITHPSTITKVMCQCSINVSDSAKSTPDISNCGVTFFSVEANCCNTSFVRLPFGAGHVANNQVF